MEEITAALLLEQAAVAELSIYDTPFRRKAAFHLSMAAQRYEKTGYVSAPFRVREIWCVRATDALLEMARSPVPR